MLCICSVDPFTKKDWYDVKAPSMFNTRNIGKTIVTRTIGTSLSCFISASMQTVLLHTAQTDALYKYIHSCYHFCVLSSVN